MLRFNQTSRVRGDETASYSVRIDKENVSLREFINHLITKRNGEWGYVKIQKNGCPWYSSIYEVEYRWGQIVSDNIPEDVKDKIIPTEIFGDGGWSRMDYVIKLEQLK